MTISVPSGVSTYVTNASNYMGAAIRVDGTTLYNVNYCGDAALYYLNSKGGYDAFLIEGKVTRTDKYTQQDYFKSYDNTTIEFGRMRFITEVTPTWELNTGWLTDEAAERLARNLFPSTRIWIHTLDDDKVYPAVIADTAAAYKTQKNNGDKLISYTIKVEGSQTFDRR